LTNKVGFEARRRAELGSDVYDAVYKSEHPFAALSTLKKQVEGYDLSDDDEVIELDSNWRNDIDANALYGPEVRALIEANEAKSLLSAGLAIRLQTVKAESDARDDARERRAAYTSRDGRAYKATWAASRKPPFEKSSQKQSQKRTAVRLDVGASTAADAGVFEDAFEDALECQPQTVECQPQTVGKKRLDERKSVGSAALADGHQETYEFPIKPKTARFGAGDDGAVVVEEGVAARVGVPARVISGRVENGGNAFALLYVPIQPLRYRAEHHFVMKAFASNGEPILIGRETPERLSSCQDSLIVFKKAENKYPRHFAQLHQDEDGMFWLEKCTCKESKGLYVDGVERLEAAVLLRHASTVEFTTSKATNAQSLKAYFLKPSDSGFFELPKFAAVDFKIAQSAKEGPGRRRDDPISFVEEDDRRGLECSPAAKGRKRLGDILGDDKLSSATIVAKEHEAAKKRRLAENAARRASNDPGKRSVGRPLKIHDLDAAEAAGWIGRKASPEDVLEDALDDGLDAIVLSDEGESQVLVPRYLCKVLKPHQIQGMRFLYDQTVESLQTLNQPDDAATPLGCVLAHCMGLGKSLTSIAFVAALLSHPQARERLKTVLIVAPTNVVRNWEAEFKKWCKRDAALAGRVCVVDTSSCKDLAARVFVLEKWQRLGGVCVMGYDLYASTVKAKVATAKTRKKFKVVKETYEALVRRGGLPARLKSITVLGKPGLYADLMEDGTIKFACDAYTKYFASPLKFLREVGGGNGRKYWTEVFYQDVALENYRTSETVAVSEANSDSETLAVEARRCLQDPGPDVCILDEAHMIKNYKTNKFIALDSMRTRRRIALTGTPLQNNLMEYHNMITFVRGGALGTRAEFKNRFADPIENGMCSDSSPSDVVRMKRRTHVLLTQISDFVQRMDQSVLAREVGKTEYLVVARFQPLQKMLYAEYVAAMPKVASLQAHQPILKLGNHPQTHLMRAAPKDTLGILAPASAAPTAAAVAAAALQIDFDEDPPGLSLVLAKTKKKKRKKRDDEYESDDEDDDLEDDESYDADMADDVDADEQVVEKLTEEPLATEEPSPKAKFDWRKRVAEELAQCDAMAIGLSAKMMILFDLLVECTRRGDKMVVFSQSLPTLDYLEAVLKHPTWHGALYALGHSNESEFGGWKANRDYYRIDGGVSERQGLIEAFEADSVSKLFMLSTRAGNMGINLVSANRVVMFDASWNPANDRQALFRCFRFGQQKHVFIYRLVSPGLEASVQRRAAQKELLSHKVIDERHFERIYDTTEMSSKLSAESPDSFADDHTLAARFGRELLESDGVLESVLHRRAVLVASAIITDTLLRENLDEKLDESDELDAMDEFVRERDGRPSKKDEEAAVHHKAAQLATIQRNLEASARESALASRESALASAQQAVQDDLPEGWERFDDEKGRPYYHHQATAVTSWEKPT